MSTISKSKAFTGVFVTAYSLLALAVTIYDAHNAILCVLAIIALNIYWGSTRKYQRANFILFNITFFTFLVSRMFIEWSSGKQILVGFNETTHRSVYMYLSLSLVFITIGVKLYEIFSHEEMSGDVKIFTSEVYYPSKNDTFTEFRGTDFAYEDEYDNIDGYNGLLLQVVTIGFYLTYPFYMLTLLEKTLYVSATSYYDLYTTYSSSIPYVFTKIGELNLILFTLFMSIEYRKRRLALPVFLFLLSSVTSMGIGQRNIFVLNMILLGLCLYYANKKSVQRLNIKLYSTRQVMMVLAMIPVGIVFLAFWGNFRQGGHTSFSFTAGIKDFFESQGGQIDFFANTIQRGTEVWKQKVPYTFASLYNYFRNLFGMLNYSVYSKEFALYGNSLGVTQFYITSPTSLESGRGTGCCFLSELLFDWGVPGIIFGSIFLGFMLKSLRINISDKPWKNAFKLLMIRGIIYIPRASYFDWISNAFNIWNVTIVLLLYAFVRLYQGRTALNE